jgi:acetyl-CoA carboxylase carboxyltransferase component
MSKVREQVQELLEKRATVESGGGDKAIEKQHDRGKWTARERINYFFDPDTFMEIDLFATGASRPTASSSARARWTAGPWPRSPRTSPAWVAPSASGTARR